ncbi:hypothetical protein [Labedaea rhizosphaerae]|uniref:Uncharacterized protein n=1 Tax=Labedaea rhizosphaerae TaxID=598644 RepID=A0A4R6SJU0_LABRH|nr:hypothetical protein [Labedaea rhizosphaerae]TDQ01278.1 hypothetical protein EV186_1021146 [Labedaea rhizosphaerae]
MTTLNDGPLARSDLYYSDRYELRASGLFAFPDAAYNVTFVNEEGVRRCLDVMLAFPDKPATPRFVLRPEGYRDERPEWPVCTLRFDYDIEHQVAAAVMLTLDKDANTHPWMSQGTVGRDDVELTYDSWAPQERPFPPESLITIAELREVVVQWAFGDALPPAAIAWAAVDPDLVGW